MYKTIIRPLLFLFDPESIHDTTFGLLKFLLRIPGFVPISRFFHVYKNPKLERELFGLKFKNPVGLAAGFDKDAKLIDELATMGFGFIEIGTLTPKPQLGNEKPRLFRLPEDHAVINRMGFNNGGVEQAVDRLRKRKSKVIIGGNIGKNKVTPNEDAAHDYERAFEALFDYVDYFVVNVSSPNTPNLRELQEKEPLKKLLQRLKDRNEQKQKPKPILLKIAPDMTLEQLDDVVEIVLGTKIDGLIATNTTISREDLVSNKQQIDGIGAGGLSGVPLRKKSTEVVRHIHEKSNGRFPIVAVGGICSAEDALEKLDAGASLVQVYTGFIYEGPSLIKRINKAIAKQRS